MRMMLLTATLTASLAACDKTDATGLEASLSDDSAVSLAGTWVFNADLSDKPPEPPTDAKPPEGGGHPGPGGPGGPGGPMGAPHDLVISQTATTITFSGSPKSMTLRTDGSVTTMSGPGGSMEISARWDGGALIVTRALPNGGQAAETYTRSGNQLTITVKLSGVTPPDGRPAPPESMRRVFDLR